MATYDPNLIVRLVPLNERTRVAWKDPRNALFYVPASFIASEERDISSRAATPSRDDIYQRNKAPDLEPEIRLTLDHFPKDITAGFMFGRSSLCDIYCGRLSKNFNISCKAFSIKVNVKGQVVLKYLTSKSNISVQYGNQDPGVRESSTWILFRDVNRGITIKVVNELVFFVIVSEQGISEEDFRRQCCKYLAISDGPGASMPNSTMDSQPAAIDLSQTSGPDIKPFYYRCMDKVLGSGSYGKVYLVYEASTGHEYAGKEFYCDQVNFNESYILASQCHMNVVRFMDFTLEGGPLLVMEYVRWGNLARPWRINDEFVWKDTEIAVILYQCLQALAYLHTKPTIIHRDIKPENILVECRYPMPHVKIGDFGLAQEGSRVGGEVGTLIYSAPEIFSGIPYGPPVDIWSLGVVTVQLLLQGRLPQPTDGIAHGAVWCDTVAAVAWQNYVASEQQDRKFLKAPNESFHTALWGILWFMLRVDPNERFSAADLLVIGRWGVFEYLNPQGTATPEDQPAHPVVTAPNVKKPENYNSVASRVAYNPGVDEAEVRKDQGSKGDATVKPPQPTQLKISPPAVHAEASAAGPSNSSVNRQRSDSDATQRAGPYPAASHRRNQSTVDAGVEVTDDILPALLNAALVTDQSSSNLPISERYKDLYESTLASWVSTQESLPSV